MIDYTEIKIAIEKPIEKNNQQENTNFRETIRDV